MSRSKCWVLGVVVSLGLGCSDGGSANDDDDASGGSSGASSGGSSGSRGSSGSSGSGGSSGQTGRRVLSCAELETKIEADARAFDIETEVTLGVWEGAPDALKVLPEGAELCGSVDVLNQGLIASELAGPALEAYYAPIFEGLGCAPFECTVESRDDLEQWVCTCFGDDTFGSLTTAPDVAYYLLAYQ